MRSRHQITAFYIEALILILVFVGIILLLTNIFGAGFGESTEAKYLTKAVTLAQNGAEMAQSSLDQDELLELMNEDGNAVIGDSPGTVEARYNDDLEPDKDGAFLLRISWNEKDEMVENGIEVFVNDREEPVYTLDTAHFVKEGEA